MRKGKLSQRKEVGGGHVLYQKNEGREAGQKNIPGGSLPAYCLILSHSEPMESTKKLHSQVYTAKSVTFPKVRYFSWDVVRLSLPLPPPCLSPPDSTSSRGKGQMTEY